MPKRNRPIDGAHARRGPVVARRAPAATAARRRGRAALAVPAGRPPPPMLAALAATPICRGHAIDIWQVDERVAARRRPRPQRRPARRRCRASPPDAGHRRRPRRSRRRYAAGLPSASTSSTSGWAPTGTRRRGRPATRSSTARRPVDLSRPYQGRVRMTLTPPVVDARPRPRRAHHRRRQGRRRRRLARARRRRPSTLPIARVRRTDTVVVLDPAAAAGLATAGAAMKLDVGCSMQFQARVADAGDPDAPAAQRRGPVGDRRALRDRAAGADRRVHRRPRQPVPAHRRARRADDDQRRGDRRHRRRDRRRHDRAAGPDRPGARLGAAVPACRAATASPTSCSSRPSRSPATPCPATRRPRRSARGSTREIAYEYGTSSASTSAVETLRDAQRRVPRLRPPRHRPVPQPRHPGPHGRRLPPRARADGPARLVRGLRRRALVHVRRHPARARRATGSPSPTGATPPTSPSSPSSVRWRC